MAKRPWTDGNALLRLTVIVGFGVLVALACLHLAGKLPGWIVLAWIVVMIAALIGCGVVMLLQGLRKNREADRQRAELAQRLGFQYVGRPTRKDRARVAKMIGHVPVVGRHRGGVGWYMLGEIEGRSSILVHHTSYRHTGHAIAVVYQLVAAAACSTAWPSLSVSRNATPTFDALPGFRQLRRKLSGVQDVQLESAEFGKLWDVRCESADFAVCFLTPAAQQFISGAGISRWDLNSGVLAATLGITDQLEAVMKVPHQLLEVVESAPAMRSDVFPSKF